VERAKLSLQDLGHLNYLHSVLAQPIGSWHGFYHPQSQTMNFALRYQLAFASYALAAMAQRTPAYRTPYAEAIGRAIEKMLHVEVWGYWRAPDPTRTDRAGPRSPGHVAVLTGPHQKAPPGPPSDPIAHDNLQYSGHLSTMLGLYEKVSGHRRYDQPFTLQDPASGVSYTYTHGEVAARIHTQMLENPFGGVCCEQRMAYVPCNNYALASNTLHDALHGTNYRQANRRWLSTLRRRLVLRGPALRGVFGVAYVADVGLAAPVAFNFTDAWGLAFLLPFDRPLVRRLYPKFRRRVTRAGSEGAYVGSSTLNEKLEISDVAINTGFGLVLARGVGDMELAGQLHGYAVGAFDAGWRGSHYLYRGAPRALYSTALYALAGVIEPGGEGFTKLFNDPPGAGTLDTPCLERVLVPDGGDGGDGQTEAVGAVGAVGVCAAEYDAGQKALHIGLIQVMDPTELRTAGRPVQAELLINPGRGGVIAAVHAGGQALPAEQLARTPDGRLRVVVKVEPSRPTQCVIYLA
jgi:hypothetical protein